jgi:WD40 repeat protein
VDPTTGKAEPFAEKHHSFASGCVLLPDGKTMISGGYDGWLLWHDVATKRCWRRVQAHQFWNWQLALSPDGRHLATVTGQYLPGGWKYEPAQETEPSVKVFDTLTGEPVAAFSHGPPVLSCCFSPDGLHLAAANMMGDIKIWKLPASADGQPVAQWNSPDFTSWGTTKTHHYCGGIYSLAFSPDGSTLLCCGMGPMGDPMAGNGKMTWQRWNWQKGERLDQIKDGQHGTGLMEAIAWHPDGQHFIMAGRQAQGTWNAALFSAADGSLVHSIDTKKRITHARFTADGKSLILAGANGQPAPKNGVWPPWGRLQVYQVES